MKRFFIISASLMVLFAAGCQSGNTEAKNKDTEVQQAPEQDYQHEEKNQPEQDYYQDEEKNSDNQDEATETDQQDKSDQTVVNNENTQGDQPNQAVVVSEPTSVYVVVNKQRKLPDGYIPPNLVVPNVPFPFEQFDEKKQMRQVAATALEELFKGAAEANIDLVAVSGYRSYQRQTSIYNWNVKNQGKEEADKYSARPGHSEHQTGLAMDVSSAAVSFNLIEDFRQTDAGSWLADNAYKYGFVIRYPKDKEDITGYSYEPWHIRYVGKDAALEMYEQKSTLEEFFGFYSPKLPESGSTNN